MTYYTLPGGRFAAERRRELPALALAVVRFMGLGARAPRAAAGDTEGFAAASASWSQEVLQWLRIDLDVSGVEHVDWDKPHVVVALHEGILDPVVLMAHLRGPLRFVARTELRDWPVVGPILEDSGQILLEPEQPVSAARTLLRSGKDAIASGLHPVVFAQGTLLGIETAFQVGAFAVAERLGVDIVPVVIAGTHQVYEWPFSPVVRRGQPVFMKVLEPRTNPDPVELESEMRRIAVGNSHAPPRHYDPDGDGWWDGYRFTISEKYPKLAARVATHRAEVREAPHSGFGTGPPR